MPKLRLNETNIGKVPIPEKGQVLFWDDRLEGFGLRVTPTTKVFIVQSRVAGRDRRVKICSAKNGDEGAMSPEDARKEAQKLIALMNTGVDPNQVKAEAKIKGRTLEDVLNDYLSNKKLRSNTEKLYRTGFRLGLYDWRNKTPDQISPEDVLMRYDKLCTGWRASSTQHSRGKGKALASQVMRLLVQIFNYEIVVRRRNIANPVKLLSHLRKGWSQSEQRQVILLDDELEAFYKAVMDLRDGRSRDFILLLLMTGLRSQECAGLTWEEVDLKQGYVLIGKERTKNKTDHGLPLTDFLKDLFERRMAENDKHHAGRKRESNEERSSIYVFPGYGRTMRYVEPKTAFGMVSKRIGKHITPHVLRHTFATASQKLLINERLQAKLLNHTKPDITARYIHADVEMLREPMNKIGDYFLEQMKVARFTSDTVT